LIAILTALFMHASWSHILENFICDRNNRTTNGAEMTLIAAESRGCVELLCASQSPLAEARQKCRVSE